MKERIPKRILIFNVNWLGDVLFSTPVIRNVRRNFPDSFLACVIPSRCYLVLKGNPYIDEIIIFDEKDRHKGIFAKLDFVNTLKARKFDRVYLLHRSFRRALICRLAGIKERVGHVTPKRAFLLTKKIYPPQKDSCHRIDYYLNIAEKSGLKIEDRYLDFYFSDGEAAFAEKFLKEKGVTRGDFLVAINPGGNWMPKRWPKEHWAALADRLIAKLGAKVVITGSVSDIPLAEDIMSLMKEKPLIACGALNVKHLGALCKRADCFVTADTGPLHIANAVGAKKIIALFGPTSPDITGPYPADRTTILFKPSGCKIPCYVAHCPDNKCMKSITPEEVAAHVRKP